MGRCDPDLYGLRATSARAGQRRRRCEHHQRADLDIHPASGHAIRFAGNDEFYPDQQTAVLLYGDPFIKNRRPVALKFMRAYIRAVRFYNDALADGRLAGPTARRSFPS